MLEELDHHAEVPVSVEVGVHPSLAGEEALLRDRVAVLPEGALHRPGGGDEERHVVDALAVALEVIPP